jgi:DnaK suppressor protein
MPARKPSKKELEIYETLLRKALADLTGDISHLESESFQSQEDVDVETPDEGGTGGYSREITLGLLEQNESLVREVMDALQRLESGEYGRCDECECWISKARLQAVPHALHCIQCQRQAEEGAA